MAIMTFSSDLKVLQDFTDDRDALAKVIKGLTIGEGATWRSTAPPAPITRTTPAPRSRPTIPSSTSSIPTASWPRWNPPRACWARSPEKKALVYFASGVSKTGVDNEAQLRGHHQRGDPQQRGVLPDRRARPGGLGAAGRRDQGLAGRQRHVLRQFGARRSRASFQGQQETLYTLAADTGGKALLDNNDLALGIVQAQKEISSYYILGYYSHQR